jgi:hypothetical protein
VIRSSRSSTSLPMENILSTRLHSVRLLLGDIYLGSVLILVLVSFSVLGLVSVLVLVLYLVLVLVWF